MFVLIVPNLDGINKTNFMSSAPVKLIFGTHTEIYPEFLLHYWSVISLYLQFT